MPSPRVARLVIAAGGTIETSFLPHRIFQLRADWDIDVRVALSRGALDFVTPAPLAALTGALPYVSNDQLTADGAPLHVDLAACDLLVVSPASARVLVESALGSITCAVTRLVAFTPRDRTVFAPAVHPNMDRRTYEPHVARLRELGATVIGGEDLFASWADVVEHVVARLALARRPQSEGVIQVRPAGGVPR